MNINDFKDGTACVRLQRSAFKDQNYFDDLLLSLKLPKDCNVIEIKVNQRYSKFKPGGLSHTETVK